MAKDATKLKPAVKSPAENPYTKFLTLSDGRKVEISRPKGKHIMQATDMAKSMYGSTPSEAQIQACIISRICKIDDEGMNPDGFGELWAEDYLKINQAFGEVVGGF